MCITICFLASYFFLAVRVASLAFTNCQAQVFRPEELHTLQTDVGK